MKGFVDEGVDVESYQEWPDYSWNELHDSYIRGYSVAFEEDEDSNAYRRNKIYYDTKIRPHNPWEIDFHTKLSKE